MNELEILSICKGANYEKNLSAQWQELESFFNVSLPYSFKLLVDRGIPVELFSFLFLLNPFTENGDFSLENNPMIDFVLGDAQIIKSEFEGMDIEEEDNLLSQIFPIGGTENGDVLLVIKKQNAWTVAVADKYYFEVEYFEMDLSQFLIQFITGQLKPRIFPEQILLRQGWPL